MNEKEIKGLRRAGFIFALIAMGISLFLIFSSFDLSLRMQAIYWFSLAGLTGILTFLLPYIRKVSIFNSNVELEISQQIFSLLQNIQNYLFGKSDGIDWELFRKEMRDPDNRVGAELLFHFLDGWRTQQVYQLINSKEEDRKAIRKEIGKLKHFFEILIELREKDVSSHNYYSRLAYVYKDYNPDHPDNWKKAYEYINKAIARIPEEKGISFTVYRFNRLVCAINVQKLLQDLTPYENRLLEEDFAACLDEKDTLGMLTETSDVIAPRLKNWRDVPRRMERIKENQRKFNPSTTTS